MSKQISTYELNSEQQDNLWIENQCPFCSSVILETIMTVDYASWNCKYCDVTISCE